MTEPSTAAEPRLDDYALHATDKLRYGDTDRQGHVNNAVFATFLETGRVEFLYNDELGLPPQGCEFVIADLNLRFRAEITWPGGVQIGTRVGRVGTSSLRLEQALFQAGRCVASAETTIVMIDSKSRRSAAFDEVTAARLTALRGGTGL